MSRLIDINAQAQKALETTGYNTVFRYPQSMRDIPVISFYTVSESGEMSADNRELLRQGTIGIGIFADAPTKCAEMAYAVERAMLNDGWSMIYSMDVAAETDGVFERDMRFTKSFYVFDEGGII